MRTVSAQTLQALLAELHTLPVTQPPSLPSRSENWWILLQINTQANPSGTSEEFELLTTTWFRYPHFRLGGSFLSSITIFFANWRIKVCSPVLALKQGHQRGDCAALFSLTAELAASFAQKSGFCMTAFEYIDLRLMGKKMSKVEYLNHFTSF